MGDMMIFLVHVYFFVGCLLCVQGSHGVDPYQFHSSVDHPRKILFQSHTLDTTMTTNVHGYIEQDFWGNTIRYAQEMLRDSISYFQPIGDNLKNQNSDEEHDQTWLIQISNQYPINKKLRKQIEQAIGHDLGSYIPHNSFLLIAPTTTAKKVTAMKEIAWVGLYPKEAKITGSLLDHIDPFSDKSTTLDKNVEYVRGLESNFFVNVGLRERKNNTVKYSEKLVQQWRQEIPHLLQSQDKLTVLKAIRKDLVRLCISSEPNATVSRSSVHNLVFYLMNEDETHFIEEYYPPSIKNYISKYLTQSSGIEPDSNPTVIHAKGLTGNGQIVGVADSGLDFDHCFFTDNPVHDYRSRNRNENARKLISYYSLPDADYEDSVNGHGTHVVGSIAGKPVNQDAEIAKYGGTAPDAKIVFQDVGKDDQLSGLIKIDLGNDLFQIAYDEGARIHSNSWGSSQNTYTSTAKEVDQFVWKHRNFLVLVAAGNDGVKPGKITGTVGSPATMKNGIAIGASQTTNKGWETSVEYTDWGHMYDLAKKKVSDIASPRPDGCCQHSNENVQNFCCKEKRRTGIKAQTHRYNMENMADFSSRGPTADGRVKPELVAPGQYIISSRADGRTQFIGQQTQQCNFVPSSPTTSDLYSMQGTSMATPIMAGNFALVRQYFIDGYYPTGVPSSANSINPTAALLKAMVINGAHTLTGEIDLNNDNKRWVPLDNPGIYPIKQIFQGWGRADISNSLFPKNGDQIYLDYKSKVDSNEWKNYCFQIKEKGKLKATLVWTDYPGEVSADIPSVNNLDLIIGKDEQGALAGNFVNLRDEKNNIEVAYMDTAPNDLIYVHVKGTKVPQGPQEYSLVVSGRFQRSDSMVCKNQSKFRAVKFAPATDSEYFPYGAVVGGIGAAGICLLCIVYFIRLKYGIDVLPCLEMLMQMQSNDEE